MRKMFFSNRQHEMKLKVFSVLVTFSNSSFFVLSAVWNEQSGVLPNSAIPTSEQKKVSSTLYTMCLYTKEKLAGPIFFFVTLCL